ncbi:unnamed protein product [Wickerhamomyces anomalus]
MVNAIATLLFTQSYLPGALVLGKTLKQFGLPNDVKLVILLATSLTDYEMDQLKVKTDLIHSNSTHELSLLKRPELKPTFSKINLFKLTQFEKLLYLDADTLPLSNLSNLFQMTISPTQIVASPDSGWPDIFNSGLLNQYFQNENWIKLPFLYNVTPSGQYQYEPAYKYFQNDIKLLHFIGSSKPWSSGDRSDGEKWRWWRKFHEFYGNDADIQQVIHGIRPRYYIEPVPTAPIIEQHIEPIVEPEIEHVKSSLDQANEVLTNPQSFEVFETVQIDQHHWDPTREEPPVDGQPEAFNFPALDQYVNEWDKEQEHHDEPQHHEEPQQEHGEHQEHQEHYDEPLVYEPEEYFKPPPIFPWEFHQDSKPERSFSNNFDYSFDNPWQDLPILSKISTKTKQVQEFEKKTKIEQAKKRAESLAKEQEIEDVRRKAELQRLEQPLESITTIPQNAPAQDAIEQEIKDDQEFDTLTKDIQPIFTEPDFNTSQMASPGQNPRGLDEGDEPSDEGPDQGIDHHFEKDGE